MKVIGLLNEKGGVGKTTCALTLAAGLAVKGAKVLLIDADGQANATIGLRQERLNALSHLLIDGWEWEQCAVMIPEKIWQVPKQDPRGKLLLLPGHPGVFGISLATGNIRLLAERLEELEGIDVVVIDTPPTPSLLHTMLYVAMDGIILPTEAESFSLDGIRQTMNRARDAHLIRQHSMNRPPLEILGVFINKFEAQTVVHQKHQAMLLKEFGELLMQPNPKYSVWREASAARRIIWNLIPMGRAAKHAWRFVNAVERRMQTAWQKS